MKRINLCSGPRNISTALMYSFAQRRDTKVIDEPFYAHYLAVSGANHPGREEVMTSQQKEAPKVIEEVVLADYSCPVVFIKNMAHHMDLVSKDFYEYVSHIFLIRDPGEMLTSFIKTIPNPSLRDTAYKQQYEIFRYVTEELEHEPIVIDSRELLLDPEQVLTKLCKKAGILFDNGMLSWEAGPIPEDGIWAKHWYRDVHQSVGFKPYEPKEETIPDRLQQLLEECKKYYEVMYDYAIKADP